MTLAQERAARLASLPFESAGLDQSNHLTGFFRSIAELWRHGELLNLLVRRELKAKYKDSSLGFLWTLIRPIVMLLIYYFAIGKVLGAERAIPQYAVFVFSGLTIWGLFNEIVTSGTMSILSNAGLIKKVYLPREIFPLAATGSALVNFVAQFIVLIVATIILGQFPWHLGLLYVIPAVALVLLFGTAIGVLLSAVNVYLRDIQYLVEVGLLILFWMSPIVYSFGYVHDAVVKAGIGSWAEEIYLANPITVAVLAFQKAMWVAGGDPSANAVYPANLEWRLVIMIIIGFILFWIAQRVFSKLQGNFAQEI